MGRVGQRQAGTLLFVAAVALILLQCAGGAVASGRALEYSEVREWQRMQRMALEALDTTEDTVNVTCTAEVGNNYTVTCWGTEFKTEQEDRGLRMWFDILICIILILFAGTMSGLTMGLLSMDIVNLEIILKSGSPTQRKYVKRILPLVKRHHLLLVTLLIGNALAMEALPIFLDRIVHPALAILLSVTAVLFFGEIIPQALCTRYGLAIGANLFWLVWALIAVLFIIAWPISKLLDLLLGHDTGTYYRRAELKELVDIHEIGKREHTMEDGLTEDEVTVIKGALDMKNKTVRDAMTPADKVSMLNFDDVLDRKKLEKIVAEGHSRWPVYRGKRDNIIGMILIKSLILHNPDEPLPVSDLQMHRLPSVPDNVQLYHMLDMFQQGKSHLAVVVKAADCMSFEGVLSLEDIVEELIGEEILDETDVFLDVARQVRVVRAFKENLVDSERAEAQVGAADSIQLGDSSDDESSRPHAVLENYRGYNSSGDENEPLLP